MSFYSRIPVAWWAELINAGLTLRDAAIIGCFATDQSRAYDEYFITSPCITASVLAEETGLSESNVRNILARLCKRKKTDGSLLVERVNPHEIGRAHV